MKLQACHCADHKTTIDTFTHRRVGGRQYKVQNRDVRLEARSLEVKSDLSILFTKFDQLSIIISIKYLVGTPAFAPLEPSTTPTDVCDVIIISPLISWAQRHISRSKRVRK